MAKKDKAEGKGSEQEVVAPSPRMSARTKAEIDRGKKALEARNKVMAKAKPEPEPDEKKPAVTETAISDANEEDSDEAIKEIERKIAAAKARVAKES